MQKFNSKSVEYWKYSLTDALYEMFKENEQKSWSANECIQYINETYVRHGYVVNNHGQPFEENSKNSLGVRAIFTPLKALYKQPEKMETQPWIPPRVEFGDNPDHWTYNSKGIWFISGPFLKLYLKDDSVCNLDCNEEIFYSALHLFSNNEQAFVISKSGILYNLSIKSRHGLRIDKIRDGFENIQFLCCDESVAYFIDDIGILYTLNLQTRKIKSENTSLTNVKDIHCSNGKLYISTFE
eukprot:gene10936-3642_t